MGRGKEGKGTVLHMKLINTRRLAAEGLGVGERQPAGLTFSPRAGSGEPLLQVGRCSGKNTGSNTHREFTKPVLGKRKYQSLLLPLVPGPQICPESGTHLPPDPQPLSEPRPAPWVLPPSGGCWGAWQRIWAKAAWGRSSRRLPRPWLDCGLTGARQVPSTCYSPSLPGQKQLLPCQGPPSQLAPAPQCRASPRPLQPVRCREVV